MHVIDEVMIAAMQSWLSNYQTEVKDTPEDSDALALELRHRISNIEREIRKTEEQLRRAFELVEQQIYTTEQFVRRQTELSARLEKQQQLISSLTAELGQVSERKASQQYIIPHMRQVIDAYPAAVTAAEKHKLLRSVLSRIEYKRLPEPGQIPSRAEIILTVYPRFPEAGQSSAKVI